MCKFRKLQLINKLFDIAYNVYECQCNCRLKCMYTRLHVYIKCVRTCSLHEIECCSTIGTVHNAKIVHFDTGNPPPQCWYQVSEFGRGEFCFKGDGGGALDKFLRKKSTFPNSCRILPHMILILPNCLDDCGNGTILLPDANTAPISPKKEKNSSTDSCNQLLNALYN